MAGPEEMEKADATPNVNEMDKDMDGLKMSPASDSIMVSARKQQMIGVKTAAAQTLSLTRSMRTVGQIEVDERLLEHVHIKLEGWVEKLYVRFTGEKVKKDQMLFEIYSPDLVATQDEYW
jgi:Cu(I)/Ag(I) efflux system membrane fusion protein